jgi:hypothetical protein
LVAAAAHHWFRKVPPRLVAGSGEAGIWRSVFTPAAIAASISQRKTRWMAKRLGETQADDPSSKPENVFGWLVRI